MAGLAQGTRTAPPARRPGVPLPARRAGRRVPRHVPAGGGAHAGAHPPPGAGCDGSERGERRSPGRHHRAGHGGRCELGPYGGRKPASGTPRATDPSDPVPLGRGGAPHGHRGDPDRAHVLRRGGRRDPVAGRRRPLSGHIRAARRVCRRDPGVHRPALAAVRAVGRAAMDRLLPQPHDRAARVPGRGRPGGGTRHLRIRPRRLSGARAGPVRPGRHAGHHRRPRPVARPGARRAVAAVGGRAHRLRHRAAQPRRGTRHRYVVRHRRDRAGDLPRHRLPAPQHHRGARHRHPAGRSSGPDSPPSCCWGRWPACPP